MARPRKEITRTFVYRYIDKEDGIIKYVGIVKSDRLKKRILDHRYADKWQSKHLWRIEYIECANQSEAEAWESHLIALYGTGKYYNKSKVGWGVNSYLPNIEEKWKVVEDTPFTDKETADAVALFRSLLRRKRTEEARTIFDALVFIE